MQRSTKGEIQLSLQRRRDVLRVVLQLGLHFYLLCNQKSYNSVAGRNLVKEGEQLYRHSSQGMASLVQRGSSNALMQSSGTETCPIKEALLQCLQYVSTVSEEQNMFQYERIFRMLQIYYETERNGTSYFPTRQVACISKSRIERDYRRCR